MPRRTSSGSLFAVRAGTTQRPDEARGAEASGADDHAPASEVRPAVAPPRYLLISTWLRGAEAESAWITVTDAAGGVHFEGPLLPDGRVTVAIDGAAAVQSVCVRLETLRWHRQAEVTLDEPSNVYAFT